MLSRAMVEHPRAELNPQLGNAGEAGPFSRFDQRTHARFDFPRLATCCPFNVKLLEPAGACDKTRIQHNRTRSVRKQGDRRASNGNV